MSKATTKAKAKAAPKARLGPDVTGIDAPTLRRGVRVRLGMMIENPHKSPRRGAVVGWDDYGWVCTEHWSAPAGSCVRITPTPRRTTR